MVTENNNKDEEGECEEDELNDLAAVDAQLRSHLNVADLSGIAPENEPKLASNFEESENSQSSTVECEQQQLDDGAVLRKRPSPKNHHADNNTQMVSRHSSNHSHTSSENSPMIVVRRKKFFKDIAANQQNGDTSDLMELFLKYLSSDTSTRTRHDSITMSEILSQLGWDEIDMWTPKARDMFFKLAQHSKLQADQRIDIASDSDKDLWMLILKGSINVCHHGQITTLKSCQALNCIKDFDVGTYFEDFSWIAVSEEEDAEVLLLDKEGIRSIQKVREKAKSFRQSHRMSFQYHMKSHDSMTSIKDLNSATFVSNLLWVRIEELPFFLDFILSLKYVMQEPECVFDEFLHWIKVKKETVLFSSHDNLVFLFYAWLNICPSDLGRFEGKLLKCINKLCDCLYTMKTDEMMFKINPSTIGVLLQSYVACHAQPQIIKLTLPANALKYNHQSLQWFESTNEPYSSTSLTIFIQWVRPHSHLWEQGLRVGHEIIAIDYLQPSSIIHDDISNFEEFLKAFDKTELVIHFQLNLNRFFNSRPEKPKDELICITTINSYLKETIFKPKYLRGVIEANQAAKDSTQTKIDNPCIFLENCLTINIFNVNYHFFDWQTDLTMEVLEKSIARHILLDKTIPGWKLACRDETKKNIVLVPAKTDKTQHYSDLFSEQQANSSRDINQFTHPIFIAAENLLNSKLKGQINAVMSQAAEMTDELEDSKYFSLASMNMHYLAVKLAVQHFELFCKLSTCDVILEVLKSSKYAHSKSYEEYINAQDLLCQWTKVILKPNNSQKVTLRNLKQIMKLIKYLYSISAMNPFYIVLTALVECKNEYVMINNLIRSNFRKVFDAWKLKLNPTNNYKEYQNFLTLRKVNQPFIPFHLCHVNNFKRYFDKYKISDTNSSDLNEETIYMQVIGQLGAGISQLALYQKNGYNYQECIDKLDSNSQKKGLKDFFKIPDKHSPSIQLFEMWRAKLYVDKHMAAIVDDVQYVSTLVNETGNSATNTIDSKSSVQSNVDYFPLSVTEKLINTNDLQLNNRN